MDLRIETRGPDNYEAQYLGLRDWEIIIFIWSIGHIDKPSFLTQCESRYPGVLVDPGRFCWFGRAASQGQRAGQPRPYGSQPLALPGGPRIAYASPAFGVTLDNAEWTTLGTHVHKPFARCIKHAWARNWNSMIVPATPNSKGSFPITVLPIEGDASLRNIDTDRLGAVDPDYLMCLKRFPIIYYGGEMFPHQWPLVEITA